MPSRKLKPKRGRGDSGLVRCLSVSCLVFSVVAGVADASASCTRQGRAVCISEEAASLLTLEGDVRRSRGVGFKPVSPGDDLIAGDRLIVRKGTAIVGMASHCQITLQANSLTTFTKADNGFCAHGLFSEDFGRPTSPAPGSQGPQTKSASPAQWNLRAPPGANTFSTTAPAPPMELVPRASPDTSGRGAPANR